MTRTSSSSSSSSNSLSVGSVWGIRLQPHLCPLSSSIHLSVSPRFFCPPQIFYTSLVASPLTQLPIHTSAVQHMHSLFSSTCQSLLVTANDLWWLKAQLTFLLCSLCSASFSHSPSNSASFFLVPVTSLIQRRALRPGNEGNGHSVKHLLFNRALLAATRPHQEARSWTCWISDFRGTHTPLALLSSRLRWLTMSTSLAWQLVSGQLMATFTWRLWRWKSARPENWSTGWSKSRLVILKGRRANRAGLCHALSKVWLLFRGWIVYFQKEGQTKTNPVMVSIISSLCDGWFNREIKKRVTCHCSPGVFMFCVNELTFVRES